jgi:hypothetical protein
MVGLPVGVNNALRVSPLPFTVDSPEIFIYVFKVFNLPDLFGW